MGLTTSANKCQARTKNGRPCNAYAIGGGNHCFWHDPGQGEARRAARSHGGKRRQGRVIGPAQADIEPVTLSSTTDILGIIERAINDCIILENSLQRARTIGYLAGVAMKAFEVSEIEMRLAELERLTYE